VNQLKVDNTLERSADANRLKFAVNGNFKIGTQKLLSIYRLNIHTKSVIGFDELLGNARFWAAGSILYNSQVANALCSKIHYLQCIAAISQYVPFNLLRRPQGIWSVEMLVEHIVSREL
jgi:hypothetical protein